MPKQNNTPAIDPLYLAKETINFNQRELSVIEEYCRINKISAKGPMMRRIIMEKLLGEMGQNPPSLF